MRPTCIVVQIDRDVFSCSYHSQFGHPAVCSSAWSQYKTMKTRSLNWPNVGKHCQFWPKQFSKSCECYEHHQLRRLVCRWSDVYVFVNDNWMFICQVIWISILFPVIGNASSKDMFQHLVCASWSDTQNLLIAVWVLYYFYKNRAKKPYFVTYSKST